MDPLGIQICCEGYPEPCRRRYRVPEDIRDSDLLTDVCYGHGVPVLFLSQEEGLCLSWGDLPDCPLSPTRNDSRGDDTQKKQRHLHFLSLLRPAALQACRYAMRKRNLKNNLSTCDRDDWEMGPNLGVSNPGLLMGVAATTPARHTAAEMHTLVIVLFVTATKRRETINVQV